MASKVVVSVVVDDALWFIGTPDEDGYLSIDITKDGQARLTCNVPALNSVLLDHKPRVVRSDVCPDCRGHDIKVGG